MSSRTQNLRKQILLVEPDAGLRAEAEKVMRQAGHEVVSVDSASRAEGILTVSRFDLAVVGASVQGKNNTPFYQDWAEDSAHTGAPFLLLCGENESAPDLPEEAIVRCPFEPGDLLTKVSVFTGVDAARSPSSSKGGSTIFGSNEVEGALDKALGLDQIDVNESEVRGAEDNSEVKTVAKSENLVGYDAEITSVSSTQKAVTDTSKIDLAFVQNKLRDMPAQEKSVSESERLDVAPAEKLVAPAKTPQEGDHDYEWFMSEMESDAKQGASKPKKSASKPVAKQAAPAEDSVFEWNDNSAPENLANVFTAQMADAVARRVAERLVKQLNSEKFMQLIHQELQACLKERS